MTKITNLPRDLLEEIISRVPLESTRAVWSTCKTWNYLSNDGTFTKKLFGKVIAAKEKEFLMVMMMDYKVYLMSVDLGGLHKEEEKEEEEDDDWEEEEEEEDNVETIIKREGKLISLNDLDRIDISQVFHCDGLLLCINKDINSVSRLVVCNPCSGQTRSIKPSRNGYHKWDRYALGYEKKKKNNSLFRSYKILKFEDKLNREHEIREFKLYSFKSDTWNVFSLPLGWDILFYSLGVSLKGDTYWYAREMCSNRVVRRRENQNMVFLICFDFARERIGPRLHLPFHPFQEDVVTLSTIKEEQLAVLFQRRYTMRMEIWITTKIEPREVSWSKFLSVDMRPLTRMPFQLDTVSFFVDEKSKFAVVLSKRTFNRSRDVAYIVGNDGYFKQVELGESNAACYPLVCSYVPSSVHIKRPTRVIQQDRSFLVGKVHGIIGFWCFGISLFLCIFLSYICFR